MTTFLIKRFILGIVTILLVTSVLYVLLIVTMPTGPGPQYARMEQIHRQLVGQGASQGYIRQRMTGLEELASKYKLDKPWPLNYLAWLFDPEDTVQSNDLGQEIPKGIDVTLGAWRIKGSGILTLDLGRSESIASGRPIAEILNNRWGNSAILVGVSFLLSLLISLPVGIIAAVRQGSLLDRGLTFVSFLGISLPSFWLGLMLIVFLAVLPKQWSAQPGWEWLPYLPPGNVSASGMENDFINRIYHLALPAFTLSLVQIAGLSRYIRATLLEVLRKDYVRTAWAKGLRWRDVILKHALRNALGPLITLFGLALPSLVSSAVVVETVFAYPGMGHLFFDAMSTGTPQAPGMDYALTMILFVIMTVVVIISNLIADLMYLAADPRVTYGKQLTA